jgi:hypothetical protein
MQTKDPIQKMMEEAANQFAQDRFNQCVKLYREMRHEQLILWGINPAQSITKTIIELEARLEVARKANKISRFPISNELLIVAIKVEKGEL